MHLIASHYAHKVTATLGTLRRPQPARPVGQRAHRDPGPLRKPGQRQAVALTKLRPRLDHATLSVSPLHHADCASGRRASQMHFAGQLRLEHLLRYCARPPIAGGSLSLTESGHVVGRLERPWRDGTTRFVLAPLAFLQRLCALVRRPLITYHGVLAPACDPLDTAETRALCPLRLIPSPNSPGRHARVGPWRAYPPRPRVPATQAGYRAPSPRGRETASTGFAPCAAFRLYHF